MIEQLYDSVLRQNNEISELLPFLVDYAKRCDHITEFGVQNAYSTTAFVYAQPKYLRSYDVRPRRVQVDVLEDEARKLNIDFKFHQADVREIEIEETDLLFIDTWHVYSQMKIELEKHAHKARKFIICHDVITYGLVGATDGNVMNLPPDERGIWTAIKEYMLVHPEWHLDFYTEKSHGLAVFIRLPLPQSDL